MKVLSLLMIFSLVIQLFSGAFYFEKISAETLEERTVTLVGNLQSELVNGDDTIDWDPTLEATRMTHTGNDFYTFTGTLPAGTYEYKVAINGSWDESYGDNGNNISINLAEESEVTFYYNDKTHAVTDSVKYEAIAADKQPRVVGSLQDEVGAGSEWSPAESNLFLLDDNFDNVYILSVNVPAGSYDFKVVLGSTWDDAAYPGQNAKLSFSNDALVTFSFNNDTKEVTSTAVEESETPPPGEEIPGRNVVLVGSLQDELGHSVDWDPAASTTKMKHVGNDLYTFTGTLPAGQYAYKIAIGGSWDENYGAGGRSGGDISLNLEQSTEVTFYYHDQTHAIANSTFYTPIPRDKTPRIVGDIQPDINAGDDWSPATSTAFMTDYDFNNTYEYRTVVPKGNHEFKVVLGNDWGEQYPGENFKLNVVEATEVTFTFNNLTKEVLTDYKPSGSDGTVDQGMLYHNTWNNAYRQPFGAISAGETVTLRLAAKKDDLTRATLYVRNYLTGNTKMVNMEYVGWTDVQSQGNLEFWEATFTPEDKGVHGYKFIAGDGMAIAEYGEDTLEGEVGSAANSNAGLFQLTVYDPSYQTPDWMKEAVVYQIFPDRFFNGNPKNDTAKENARGEEPIERPDSWDTLPDNPRIGEKDPGNYTGDGIWSNDFFGGDIAGIHQKLDYIQSLGVNTLYLNPVAKAASNHKYDATDFKEVDPMFGSPEEFKAFTDELARRDMHLILDGVFNHVADDSIYFDRYGKYETVGAYEYWAKIYDLMNEKGLTQKKAEQEAHVYFKKDKQKFSRYGFHNWFNIENEIIDEGKPTERYKYQAWWGFDSLPEIKSIPGEAVNYDSELNNKQFANYIFYERDSVAKSWLTNGGSGWRLDVANEVDMEFWREFRKELKNGNYKRGATLKDGEQPLILGEIWDDASKYFLGDQYDSVMNYRFERAILGYLENGNAGQAEKQLKAVQEDYPEEAFYALMNLLGSHDTPRAVYLLGGGTDSFERAEFDSNYNHELGVQRLKLASIIQMGYAGAPTIYYGDEAGVTGSKDPDDRRTYPWGKEDQDLISHYKKIGAVREDNASLFAYGELHHAYAKDDVLVYVRTNDEKAAIVAINRGSEDRTIELQVKDLIANGVNFIDQLDSKYEAVTRDGVIELKIPKMSGRMLVSENLPTKVEPVTSLSATEGSKTAQLNWNGNGVEYVVYQTTVEGALYRKIGKTSDETFTVENLQNGRQYFFAVVSVDENGNESEKVATSAVIPHYDLTAEWVGNLTTLENSTLDLSAAQVISAELYVEGATETEQAEGVIARLEMKKDSETQWEILKAGYAGQAGNNNVFSGSFLPLEVGTYEYRIGVSSDLGREWKYTETTNTVTFVQDEADQTAPATAVELAQPMQESGQVNLSWTVVDSEDPYLYTILRDGIVIDQVVDGSLTSYRDYQVENGKTYQYQVRVYDKVGNFVDSNIVTVTPDIVMVQVTFKVNAPDYTPLTTSVNMPNSINGWNAGAWSMTRNGAVTPDWEYTVEVQEGTEITYKYVKGNSWDQEGLADHTPNNRTDDDISYYGYGAIGTDMKVVVQNQGNNKMVVQDYIVRWIDMPVVVTSHENNATVTTETIELKGTAIKGGVLTINGEQVTINDDMSFSHTVTLAEGKNDINISIKPSEDSKKNIFNNDSGAIAKNTKTIVLTVNKQ